MANPLKYVSVPTANKPAAYVQPTDTTSYTQREFSSKYGNQLDSALNNVTNFSYDPLKDASYQALAKVYSKRGEQAAKNTMADAAMLNGGLGTSYAASAAQQVRNDYNSELASLIPDLEERAYNRNVQTLAALGDAEDREYGRYRDQVGDDQWKYGVDYQKYRDTVGDTQWKYSQDYQAYRDTVADSQWARNYNLDIYNLKQSKKNGRGGGGGGGGRRGGGGSGGGYSGGSGSSGSFNVLNTMAKVGAGGISVSNAALRGKKK